MPSLVEIGPVVLEKMTKIGKVYRRTDRRRMTGDQKSSLEFSAQVSLKGGGGGGGLKTRPLFLGPQNFFLKINTHLYTKVVKKKFFSLF